MQARVLWRKRAEFHLQSIFDYIASDSPRAASAYAEDIIEASQRLGTFPSSGRRFSDDYRALPVRNHLIFYRYDPAAATVVIVAVIDGRRDPVRMLHDLGVVED